MIRQTLLVLSILATTLYHPPSAEASYAAKWFDGNWNCKIGDRSAQMNWRMAYDTPDSKYLGKFRDNGGSWTSISEISSNYNTLRMRFDRTNASWTLTHFPRRGVVEGSINLQRQRQPISCTKGSQSEDRQPLKPEVEQPPVILR
jgi:Family of unknown function (DUF6006)